VQGAAKEMYSSMSEQQLEEFASTKRKAKPESTSRNRSRAPDGSKARLRRSSLVGMFKQSLGFRSDRQGSLPICRFRSAIQN
jgi:Protein of unknwon function (DUF3008)